MSILAGAAVAVPTPIIVTICGMPGSGKSSLAATFPRPFMIRTQGEAIPRDIANPPVELGETDSVGKLWEQLMALARDEHDYQTLIIDSVTGLETLFVDDVMKSDPKARSIQQAAGGYGAGRDMVTAMHNRVRRAATALQKRGMNTVFLAHSDITRIEPPDSDGYTQYSLRLHAKSLSPYVDSVDVVGFLKQNTIVRGDDGERKRAITDDERLLVTYMTPTAVTKNRLGITEDIPVIKGENPLAPWVDAPPAKARKRVAKATPVIEEEQSEEEVN